MLRNHRHLLRHPLDGCCFVGDNDLLEVQNGSRRLLGLMRGNWGVTFIGYAFVVVDCVFTTLGSSDAYEMAVCDCHFRADVSS